MCPLLTILSLTMKGKDLVLFILQVKVDGDSRLNYMYVEDSFLVSKFVKLLHVYLLMWYMFFWAVTRARKRGCSFHSMLAQGTICQISRSLSTFKQLVLGCWHYKPLKSTVQREIFTGPNFDENPVSPPEEIFSVLIFALMTTPLYCRRANQRQKMSYGKGQDVVCQFEIALQCHRQTYDQARLAHKTHGAKISKSSRVQIFMVSYFAVLIFTFWSLVAKIMKVLTSRKFPAIQYHNSHRGTYYISWNLEECTMKAEEVDTVEHC